MYIYVVFQLSIVIEIVEYMFLMAVSAGAPFVMQGEYVEEL